jgi:hypothetical protein
MHLHHPYTWQISWSAQMTSPSYASWLTGAAASEPTPFFSDRGDDSDQTMHDVKQHI